MRDTDTDTGASDHDGTSGTAGRPGGRRRRTVVAIVAVAVLIGAVVLVVLALAPSPDAGGRAPGASASPSASEPAAAPSPTDGTEPTAPAGDDTTTTSPGGAGEVATVPFEEEAEPVTGLVIRVELLEAVDGTSGRPGEIAGPAVRATIVFRNATNAPIDLTTFVVNAYGGADGVPADTLSGPDAAPLPQQVEAGTEVRTSIVWNVPLEQREQFRIEVDGADAAPVVAFTGSAPA